jgi:hypothetical protein
MDSSTNPEVGDRLDVPLNAPKMPLHLEHIFQCKLNNSRILGRRDSAERGTGQ